MLNRRVVRKSHSPLHGSSVIFVAMEKHQCRMLTASVVEIVETLTVCRPSQERNRVSSRRHTQNVDPDCGRWVNERNIDGFNFQTYTAYPIPT